jgi:hypothetical protein
MRIRESALRLSIRAKMQNCNLFKALTATDIHEAQRLRFGFRIASAGAVKARSTILLRGLFPKNA